jgi:hypothetical protein
MVEGEWMEKGPPPLPASITVGYADGSSETFDPPKRATP